MTAPSSPCVTGVRVVILPGMTEPTDVAEPAAEPPAEVAPQPRRLFVPGIALGLVFGIGATLAVQAATHNPAHPAAAARTISAPTAAAIITSTAPSAAVGPSDPVAVELNAAWNTCQYQASDTARLADGGHSIIIDTHSGTTSLDGVSCILAQLQTPDSLIAQINATTALQGAQHATVGVLSYEWTYHPDNGLNMVITAAR